METYQSVVTRDVLKVTNLIARGDMKVFSSYIFGEPKVISRFDISAKSHLCVIVAYIVQYSEDEAIQELSDVVYNSLINYARNEGLDLSYEPAPINYLPYEEREELINSIRYIKYLYEGTAVVDSLAMAD